MITDSKAQDEHKEYLVIWDSPGTSLVNREDYPGSYKANFFVMLYQGRAIKGQLRFTMKLTIPQPMRAQSTEFEILSRIPK